MMAARPLDGEDRSTPREPHLPTLVRQALAHDGLVLALVVLIIALVAVF